ncbi:SIMPL domain-containing protein [Agriterribacter sp.]|uniref:SIMPL domain-containing protein n=1 Tax=Agriterribacter sp. TaxID=2821509 RepID=UPI002C47BE47|nr:SIMPL domain-containing protein [Agriterribacter sp.]HTN09194.1 SIMPL domain-containing protein [Agriterribacter sp.]
MKKLVFTSALAIAISAAAAQVNNPVYNNPYPRTINVTGSAEMEIVPDEIYVQVTLSEYEKKGSGKISIEAIQKKFLEQCKSAGIPDSLISIALYQGADRLYWQQRKKKTPGMMATISYIIQFNNMQKIDAMVEKLDDEATQGFYIVKTPHSKIAQFRRQLKIQAVKEAKDKAIYLAEAIGEKAGAAISIQEPVEYSIMPVYKNAAAANMMLRESAPYADATESGNIDFKKIRLKFEVQTIFALQ